LIPAGELVTVPVPVPVLLTFRVWVTAVNVAVTERFTVIETVQVPVPEQSPFHPAKTEPDAAVWLKITEVPLV
jgi:hypothetical protein